MTAELIVLMGIPGCGKSTWAKEHVRETDAVYVSTDDIREELTGDATRQDANDDVFSLAHQRVASALVAGCRVVFDSTAVTVAARGNMLAIAHAANDTVTKLVVFATPFMLCMQRNEKRERVVPDHVMDKMNIRYITSLSEIGYEGWDQINIIRPGRVKEGREVR